MSQHGSAQCGEFRLVGISQELKGHIWPLNERPLRLGRSRDCDICMADRTVSRQHCEISGQNGSFVCVNCSDSGVVLVNGEPTDKAVLRPGDELAIGGYAFVLAQVSAQTAQHNKLNELSTDQAGPRIESPGATGAALKSFPANVRDVFLLLKICREAAACESLGAVLATFANLVRERFAASNVWLLRYDTLKQRFVEPDASPSTNGLTGAPLSEMKQVLGSDRTAAFPATRKRPDRALVACPIAVAETIKYVLAFETDALQAKSCEEVTEFCAVLAHQIGPIALAVESKAASRRSLDRVVRDLGASEDFVGETPAAREVRRLAMKATTAYLPVLILGETGVGKEIIAKSIHKNSKRANGPFVVCNCPAIAAALFESELFGHESGAFTGAVARHRGLFEQADGGTLFLDEIGDLNPEHQAKILRALETGVIRRVGGSNDIALKVRVVAAANNRLLDAVSAGRFRDDLFHRLCGIEIFVPPLRDRRDDIPLLAEHFAVECAVATGGTVRALSEDALETLASYAWPGNVRELRQVIGRSYALTDRDLLCAKDIALGTRASASTRSNDKVRSLAAVEREHIAAVLEATGGQKSKSADLLGIGRDTLRRKIRIYGLPY